MNFKKALITGTVTATLFAQFAIPAFADVPGATANPAPQQSGKSDNCIAIYSARVIHNGQYITLGQGGDPSHGTRGDEIKGYQATCNNANNK